MEHTHARWLGAFALQRSISARRCCGPSHAESLSSSLSLAKNVPHNDDLLLCTQSLQPFAPLISRGPATAWRPALSEDFRWTCVPPLRAPAQRLQARSPVCNKDASADSFSCLARPTPKHREIETNDSKEHCWHISLARAARARGTGPPARRNAGTATRNTPAPPPSRHARLDCAERRNQRRPHPLSKNRWFAEFLSRGATGGSEPWKTPSFSAPKSAPASPCAGPCGRRPKPRGPPSSRKKQAKPSCASGICGCRKTM